MMWLFIGVGGFLGAISRLYITQYSKSISQDFPIGTLIVNIIGSFLLGIVTKLELINILPNGYFFIGAGYLGSLTTFSTFSLDTVLLIKQQRFYRFSIHLLSHLILGIGAAVLGYYLF